MKKQLLLALSTLGIMSCSHNTLTDLPQKSDPFRSIANEDSCTENAKKIFNIADHPKFVKKVEPFKIDHPVFYAQSSSISQLDRPVVEKNRLEFESVNYSIKRSDNVEIGFRQEPFLGSEMNRVYVRKPDTTYPYMILDIEKFGGLIRNTNGDIIAIRDTSFNITLRVLLDEIEDEPAFITFESAEGIKKMRPKKRDDNFDFGINELRFSKNIDGYEFATKQNPLTIYTRKIGDFYPSKITTLKAGGLSYSEDSKGRKVLIVDTVSGKTYNLLDFSN